MRLRSLLDLSLHCKNVDDGLIAFSFLLYSAIIIQIWRTYDFLVISLDNTLNFEQVKSRKDIYMLT